jgi:hypothetical protein
MTSLIKPLFEDGVEALLKKADEAEGEKVGVLRGGNTGIYIKEKNLVLGKCARETYLRYKGIQISDVDPSRKLMFEAGISNEDSWYTVLKEKWEGQIKREEEIPTSWKTSNGTLVTGRPDIVLCKDDGTPVKGIELKLACSIWTCRDILIEDTPKFPHLIQAAHYMWQVGCPFELWYTNRADFHPNEMVERLMPKYNSAEFNRLRPYLEIVFYQMVKSKMGNVYKKRLKVTEEEFRDMADTYGFGWKEGNVNPGVLKIYPFIAGYTLRWEKDGRLSYTSVQTGNSYTTEITAERIRDYFELVSRIEETGKLPPKVVGVKPNGERLNYDINDYSPIKEINDTYEKQGLDVWLEKVIEFSKNRG